MLYSFYRPGMCLSRLTLISAVQPGTTFIFFFFFCFKMWPFLQGHPLLIFIINSFSRKRKAVQLSTSWGREEFWKQGCHRAGYEHEGKWWLAKVAQGWEGGRPPAPFPHHDVFVGWLVFFTNKKKTPQNLSWAKKCQVHCGDTWWRAE